ncbi:hypothetical protein [Algibacter sp. 2305UL17-15]|uniref:hypothetical protein n=1 Tax=Algibacter sp. 2305UL17-15 TaxID=3231268 RepID=UPI003457B3DE
MDIFNIGDIVTLKSHPLFRVGKNKTPQKISEFSAQVPPLMLIKEVVFENKETKTQFDDKIEGSRIADLVKYSCVYFNANKSEFVEKTIYHSFLQSYKELKYFKKEKTEKPKDSIDLITEVSSYIPVLNYEYGKQVQFKTKKLEHRKSYALNNEKISGTSFQTPDFIVSGIRNEEQKDLFYPNREPKRIVCKQLFKVIWFCHFQQKFSEYFLPKEFLVEGLEI